MPNPTPKKTKTGLKPGQRAATMGDFLAFDRKARAERAATERAAKLKKGKAANRALVLKRRAANKARAAEIKRQRDAAAQKKKIGTAGNPFSVK